MDKELNQYLAADISEGEEQAQEIALLRAEVGRLHRRLASSERTITELSDRLARRTDEVVRTRVEMGAYRRAKQENDERFQLAAAEQRERAEKAEAELEFLRQEMRAEKQHADPDAECLVCTHLTIEQQIERAEKAERALAWVKALHFRRPWSFLRDSLVFGQANYPDRCDHCRRDWPCETVAALKGGDDAADG